METREKYHRNLSVMSGFLVLYFVAGAELDKENGEITTGILALTATNVWALYTLPWVLWAWFLFRYWQTVPFLSIYRENLEWLKENIRSTQAGCSVLQRAYERAIDAADRDAYPFGNLRTERLQEPSLICAVSSTGGKSGQKKLEVEVGFRAEPGLRVALFAAQLWRDSDFLERCSPYVFAAVAALFFLGCSAVPTAWECGREYLNSMAPHTHAGFTSAAGATEAGSVRSHAHGAAVARWGL